jgi:hypothetical protein
MVRMPERFVPWAVIKHHVYASLKREHGKLPGQIHTIEGFAGFADGDTDNGEGKLLCERAFAGEPCLLPFALHAWDDRTCTFRLVRKGQ